MKVSGGNCCCDPFYFYTLKEKCVEFTLKLFSLKIAYKFNTLI